ncbi:MAG: hypothetical protein ACI9VR_003187 [Cognaticolwellia sp.]
MELSESGEILAKRQGEQPVQLATDKGFDAAGLLTLLGQPEWASLGIGVWAEPDTSTQDVVELISTLSIGLGHRSEIAIGPYGSPSQHIVSPQGQQVWVLPLPIGGRAGECLFASDLDQCMGRNGALHDWQGDGCHLDPR